MTEWKYNPSVNKSCNEDEFIGESMFCYTIHQLNIGIACDTMHLLKESLTWQTVYYSTYEKGRVNAVENVAQCVAYCYK